MLNINDLTSRPYYFDTFPKVPSFLRQSYLMEDPNSELESFRQQWKAEVSARTRAEGSKRTPSSAETSRAPRRPPAAPRIPPGKTRTTEEEEEDHADPQPFIGLDAPRAELERGESSKAGSAEPRSALEHYEKAVEKESQGSLGDSLDHYRKAFKVRPAQDSR
jgi:F-box protein 9